MVKATPLIASVNAGEFGPRMAARVEFAKYPNACETLENCFALPQGAAQRRPGTRFVAPVKTPAQRTRLLPFEFSTEQAYVIEAGDGVFRFFREQAQIVVAATDAAISNGDFVSGIAGWTDRSTGSASISHDAGAQALGLNGAGASVAHGEQSVATTALNVEHVLAFEVLDGPVTLRIGSTSTGAELLADESYGAGVHTRAFTPAASPFFVQFLHDTATVRRVDNVSLLDDQPVEVPSIYGESELFALKYAQSADVLFIAHPDHPVHSLTRRGHESWSFGPVEFVDGPYLDENTDDGHTLNPGGTTGTVSVSANKDTFAATDVGRLVRLHGGWAKLTAVTDARNATMAVQATLSSVAATAAWRLGAWSATTGYPRAVTFYEQRFWGAGARLAPQRIDGTRIGVFDTFTPGTADDDAVSYTMAADKVNAIVWISPGDSLAVGTVGGEWIVRASDLNQPITPANVQIKLNETIGSADVQPARVGPALLFAARDGRRVHEFAFNLETDGFRAPDMTILAEHIGVAGFGELAFQRKPDSLLWAVRGDGQLATFTYNRPEDVLGWSRQVTDGAFESVAVIPGVAGDEVWVVCRRTLGGAETRCIEVFADGAFDTQADGFFVDCGLSYDGMNADPAMTLRLSAADWTVGKTGTLTAVGHAPFSDPGSVGARFHLEAGGDFVEVDVIAVASATSATVSIRSAFQDDVAVNAVPVGLRGVAMDDWADRSVSAVTAVAGLGHLDGETVAVLADGAVHPAAVVSGGNVALDYPALKVHVGLPYASVYRSLRLNAGSRRGTAVAQTKRVHRVSLDLYRSGAPRIGASAPTARRLKWRDVGDLMDRAPPLITGERSIKFDQGFVSDPRLTWVQDLPLPTMVRALVPHLQTYER